MGGWAGKNALYVFRRVPTSLFLPSALHSAALLTDHARVVLRLGLEINRDCLQSIRRESNSAQDPLDPPKKTKGTRSRDVEQSLLFSRLGG